MVHERAERWTGLRSERGEALREASSEDAERKVSAHDFYGEYHGHRIEHLHKVHTQLRSSQAGRSVIFLCGDSTLDNKYWLPGIATSRAVNGFEQVLDPPVMQKGTTPISPKSQGSRVVHLGYKIFLLAAAKLAQQRKEDQFLRQRRLSASLDNVLPGDAVRMHFLKRRPSRCSTCRPATRTRARSQKIRPTVLWI